MMISMAALLHRTSTLRKALRASWPDRVKTGGSGSALRHQPGGIKWRRSDFDCQVADRKTAGTDIEDTGLRNLYYFYSC
ncbi:hypothetical protein [Mesorhizobium japonicum]|uniref:hypothetical protein n=1 Tax=Mesorhizobium japonicum TaxID=2066070 RepID=UPI0012FF53E6|nr:hypothetical protein [Mesorhizobium japonicum]